MKKNLFLLTFICTSTFVLAQDTTKIAGGKKNRLVWISAVSRDSLNNPGRNEISTNIIPFAGFLMGSYGNDLHVTLMYKRVSADYRKAWRFGVGMYESETYSWGNTFTQYYQVTDTSRIANQFMISGTPSFRANIGYEWRGKGRRRLQSWIGADLIAGGFVDRYNLADFKEIKDSTGEWGWDFSSGTNAYEPYGQNRSFFFQAGVSVNAGLRYALNRYFLINFQTGADVYAYMGTEYKRVTRTTMRSEKTTGVGIHAPALINEVSLVFRF
ncbi:MAG: hypothetical protein MUC87_17575 [Bacteroidia bacterium]|jgi:hypothetical protein|nr:hypothetical protein [Bacteroidia bacterium]